MTARRTVSRILLACLLAALVSACAGQSVNRKKEAEARMQMGVTYLDQRNLPMAMRELTRADELDPGNPEIEMMLGMTYIEQPQRDSRNFAACVSKLPNKHCKSVNN